MKTLLQSTVVTFIVLTMTSNLQSHAASFSLPEKGITPISWRDMKLKTLLSVTPKEFRELTGQKMKLREKLAFSLLKGKMKKELKKNPEMTTGEFMDSIGAMNKAAWIILGLVVLALLFLIIIVNQLPD